MVICRRSAHNLASHNWVGLQTEGRKYTVSRAIKERSFMALDGSQSEFMISYHEWNVGSTSISCLRIIKSNLGPDSLLPFSLSLSFFTLALSPPKTKPKSLIVR